MSAWKNFAAQAAAVAFAFLAAGMVAAEARSVSFHNSHNGARVSAAGAEAALARSGLVARLGAGARAKVYGLEVAAEQAATVYFSVSSEFIIAAVLSGTVTAPALDRTLVPGEMAYVMQAPDARPTADEFDAATFLREPPRQLPRAAMDELEGVAAIQKRRIFWGALQRTNFNVQSPVPPLVEGLRRDYLLEPAVVRLRQQAGSDPSQFALAAARRFVVALARRDVAGVRALVHPTMFLPGDTAPTGVWLARRHVFASELVSGPLPAQLAGARVSVDGTGRVIARARGQRWEVTMAPLDAAVFVSGLEPLP